MLYDHSDGMSPSSKVRHSLSAISIKLHDLGFTRKVIQRKASQARERQRQDFVETLTYMVDDAEMLLFLDESNKDRVAALRKWGWSKKGEGCNFHELFNWDTRYTFAGAADVYGFVPQACETFLHKVDGKEESQPLDSNRYVEYIRDIVCPTLGNYLQGEPHSVVCMDNCSIHLDPRVRQLIESRGARVVYSAPYSPDLIPIESMFKQWKDFLKKYHNEFAQDWFFVHTTAVASITPKQGSAYFRMTTLHHLINHHPLVLEDDEEFVDGLLCLVLRKNSQL